MTGVDVIPFQISLDESAGVAPSVFLSVTDYLAKKKTMPCVKNVLSWLIFWGNNTHTHTLNICKAVSKKHEIVNEVISSNAELKLKLNHPL